MTFIVYLFIYIICLTLILKLEIINLTNFGFINIFIINGIPKLK